MKESKFEKPACSVKNAATPIEIECPQCGNESEIWSDESETVCSHCGNVIITNIPLRK